MFARPVSPSPVAARMERAPLGFAPSFAPRRPGAGRRTWGRRQAVEHGPTWNYTPQLTIVDLQSGSSSLCATSRRPWRSNHANATGRDPDVAEAVARDGAAAEATRSCGRRQPWARDWTQISSTGVCRPGPCCSGEKRLRHDDRSSRRSAWLRPSSTNFEDTWLPSNGVATLPSIEPMLTIRRPFLAAAVGTPGSSPAGDLVHHEVFTTSSAPGTTAYMLFDQRHQPRWAKRAPRLLGSGCDCAAPRTSNRTGRIPRDADARHSAPDACRQRQRSRRSPLQHGRVSDAAGRSGDHNATAGHTTMISQPRSAGRSDQSG